MDDKLVPGSLWRDKTPAGNWTHPGLSPMRRVVEVVDMLNDRVHSVSFWQEQRDGVWVDQSDRRRTSILRRSFLTKFEHVRGPAAPF